MLVILQDKFDILLGRIEVKVPWVIDGDDYQVVCAYPPLLYFLPLIDRKFLSVWRFRKLQSRVHDQRLSLSTSS
jgi:hypothetical protein